MDSAQQHGGAPQLQFTTFSAVNADGQLNELLVTEKIARYVLTLVQDGVGVDQFSLQSVGNRRIFNVSLNVAAASEAIASTETVSVFDFQAQLAFTITDGKQRSLLTNVSSYVTTLVNAPALRLDGVTFAEGETAPYYQLATRPGGNVVVAADASYPLSSDGTGLVEFQAFDAVTGRATPGSTALSICGSVNTAGVLVFDRVCSVGQHFPGRRQPNPA
jgi:hypothetical protein